MSRVVIVMPSIHVPTTLGALASFSPEIIDHESLPTAPTLPQRDPELVIVNGREWVDGEPRVRLVLVWNTPDANLGVTGAWNLGVDEVSRREADWLVILSAAVRFGPVGGRDFLVALDAATGRELVVEAGGGLGWHLLAFSREVLETVGRFDPVFPTYFGDNDWSVRFQRAYDRDTHAPGFVGPLWPKVEIDAALTEIAHGIKRGGVEVNMVGLEDEMRRKWGPNEEYRTPYDDPSLDHRFVGPYPR